MRWIQKHLPFLRPFGNLVNKPFKINRSVQRALLAQVTLRRPGRAIQELTTTVKTRVFHPLAQTPKTVLYWSL
jgi:hypothetical protein